MPVTKGMGPTARNRLQFDMHRFVNESGTPEQKAQRHISPQIRVVPDFSGKWTAILDGYDNKQVKCLEKTPELAIAALAEELRRILGAGPAVAG